MKEAHLSDFIYAIGSWQWPYVTWKLTEISGLPEGVRVCLGCEDQWVWILNSYGRFFV